MEKSSTVVCVTFTKDKTLAPPDLPLFFIYISTPYNYCINNPTSFTDPDGMGPTDWYQNKVTGNIQWFNGSGARSGYGYTNLAGS